ncbi:MAG: alginate export family protein [Bacteroidales bacterium]|nr:alginate export family protein [Bacteroidales bacterium]
MKKVFAILLLISLGFCNQAFSQFVLSGEFTPRTEMSHGYGTLANPDQDYSLFTAQRTRLNFLYSTDNVKTGLVLQDVRSWGNQSQLVANEDKATSVHEAWAEVFFTKSLSLKAGRQELVYDDSRIFGNVGWAHQARSHDLALFKFEKDIKIHLGIAYNENMTRTNNLYGVAGSYKAMQFLWYNQKFGNLSLSVLALNNGIEKYSIDSMSSSFIFSQTIGPRLVFKKDKIMLAGTYYQQMRLTGGQDLSASYYHLEGSYQLSENLNLKLGYEFLSGNDQTKDSEENNAFTPLYGTNHKFNGFMDYFYVGNHGNSVGLNDIYLNLTTKIKKVNLIAFVHLFSTAADLKGADGKAMDASLGTEIDMVCAYKLNDIATIKAGYSHMLATETMETLKKSVPGAKDEMNNWAWLMLSVTPTFLNK